MGHSRAKLDDAFNELARSLKSQCGAGPVYYMANPGNWGDALIRQGTLAFFRDIGLSFIELKNRNDLVSTTPAVKTLIYGGGGAWCKLWNHGELWATTHKQRFRVIVLPSTYEWPFAIPNTTLYCRDLCESKANVPSAPFCHDLAFYLHRTVTARPPGRGIGNFFRTDAEAGPRPGLPADNVDISLQADQFAEVGPLFDALAPFETICTDRLHVAISGCLLGRSVQLYPNSYFKNRAVYLSSMRDYFDNVRFMGPLD